MEILHFSHSLVPNFQVLHWILQVSGNSSLFWCTSFGTVEATVVIYFWISGKSHMFCYFRVTKTTKWSHHHPTSLSRGRYFLIEIRSSIFSALFCVNTPFLGHKMPPPQLMQLQLFCPSFVLLIIFSTVEKSEQNQYKNILHQHWTLVSTLHWWAKTWYSWIGVSLGI